MAEVTVQQIGGGADNPRLDVVFVHGLGGDADATWRYQASKTESAFWPEWLAEDFNGLAVYSVGYPSDKMGWNTGWPLEEAAAAVLGRLMDNPMLRASAPAPIVFVCHSLGGIVVKQLILKANSGRELNSSKGVFLDRVAGVVFLATPHDGSMLATLASKFGWPVTDTMRDLIANSAKLGDLSDNYRDYVEANDRRIRHLIYYEKEGVGVGKVVNTGSANPGIARAYRVPIGRDHINICKIADRADQVYEGVLAFLDEARASSSPMMCKKIDEAEGAKVYPVWFGTNRKPMAQGDGFTGERHDCVTRGRVEVLVPQAHRFGETGTSFWRRLLRFDLRDDHLRLQHVERQERDAFFADIHTAMQAAQESGDEPHALFFLHGFNVSFEDAAIRAAQIGYDLKVPGATAFFSWPSRGSVAAYPADEASIEASERAITDFLMDFVANCGAKKVHVIAHSMGNRGLLRALQRIAANAETRGKVRFDQIFLAAPDVDRDLFLDLAHLYPAHAERATLYASDADLPVHLSSKLHDAPRAGYYTPYTVAAGVDTVAVPDFDIDLLGHAYFAQAEALLHDIFDLMRHNAPPAKRQRITPARDGGLAFWRLRK
jgi:esterase/lipase superfamily enzyme